MLLILPLAFECISGIIIITYEITARKTGWEVGRVYSQNWFLLFGGLFVIGSTFAAVYYYSWWGLFILPISWVVAALLTVGFRKNVQVVSPILIIISLILQSTYI